MGMPPSGAGRAVDVLLRLRRMASLTGVERDAIDMAVQALNAEVHRVETWRVIVHALGLGGGLGQRVDTRGLSALRGRLAAGERIEGIAVRARDGRRSVLNATGALEPRDVPSETERA